MGLQDTIQALNPENQNKIYQEFDIGLGYEEFHRMCYLQRPRRHDEEFCGVDKFQILDPETCKKVRDVLDKKDEIIYNWDFRFELLQKIFNDELVDEIESYFQTTFIPCWMRFYRNDPANPSGDPAFYWHCDGGPQKHLKLLLYLNDTSKSGGNTLFLDPWTTQEFKNIGYVFCPLQYRLEDLEELADKFGIGYNPMEFEVGEGEGVLFEPANVLHKGIWPDKEPRYMIQICIIPCALPWDEACKEHGTPLDSNAWPNVRMDRV